MRWFFCYFNQLGSRILFRSTVTVFFSFSTFLFSSASDVIKQFLSFFFHPTANLIFRLFRGYIIYFNVVADVTGSVFTVFRFIYDRFFVDLDSILTPSMFSINTFTPFFHTLSQRSSNRLPYLVCITDCYLVRLCRLAGLSNSWSLIGQINRWSAPFWGERSKTRLCSFSGVTNNCTKLDYENKQIHFCSFSFVFYFSQTSVLKPIIERNSQNFPG